MTVDLYAMEADSFEADVNLLIRHTLHVALTNLSASANVELASIEGALNRTRDDQVQYYLVEQHVDVLATGASQERFLVNMAVVALASRLLHALKLMARTAEHFRPTTHNYKGKSEFLRLWTEYRERFSVDFKANSAKIAFVEPMVMARNRIVHAGGEANEWSRNTRESLRIGQEPSLDTSFSDSCPQFVTGEGWNAEVVVRQVQLDSMCDSAVELVRWLAKELSAQAQVAST
ncbi:hypothetical protein [Luteitalea sp.]|uniref:hypothetical protein n=1 Tax=Luteitalea sp. TaxID=2004800 RepID=UPI0025C20AC5|nr:hypothetical protein [Luteitalea sp.]